MKIAVIAASGRLGKVFVETALQAGHSVHAGVRGEHDLTAHPNLKIIQCDATKPDDLRALFHDQEVVVSAIGHVKNSAPDVQTVATEQIVKVMKEQSILRFVDVTGTGVRFDWDKITLTDRFLNLGVSVVDPSRVRDGRTHQVILQQSDLDWTTIRILKLQNVAAKPYVLTSHGPTKSFVGRKEVALAMLEVIEKHSFIKEAPIISGA